MDRRDFLKKLTFTGLSLACTPALASSQKTGAFDTRRKPWSDGNDHLLFAPSKDEYSFDNFVVGPSNRLAFAAAKSLVENHANAFVPLFIVGGTGVGKTHLLRASTNAIKQHTPGTKIIYTTAEQFSNEMINGLRFSKMDEFRARYRGVDVLLIDDVHFIDGKERTGEELLCTLDTLLEAGKRVIITSNRYPRNLRGTDPQLRSRLSGGLIAKVRLPDNNLRIAILQLTAAHYGTRVPEEVLAFIASKAARDVRELKGYLLKLQASAMLSGQQVTLGMAKEVLG